MPKSNVDFSLTAQVQRREAYLAAVREANVPRFSPPGEWLAGGMVPGIRERMWHCLALLAGEPKHHELASRIIETSTDDGGDFSAFTALTILRKHEEKLSPEARQFLLNLAQAHLDHVYEHIYRYTENCGALNVFALLEAHRRFGEERFRTRAVERLEVYAHARELNGTSDEFISLNYLPVFVTGIALIGQYAEDADLREMALGIESQIWRELAAGWHPELQFSAGPSARSYTTDSVGISSGLRGLVWVVLGEAASISPRDLGLFDEPAACPVPESQVAFTQSGGAMWFGTAEFHLDEEAAGLFYQKSYPFAMQASVELTGSREHELVDPNVDVCSLGGWRSGDKAYLPATIFHPGGRALLSSYLTEDYGLGTSTRMVGTQCDFCRVIWRRKAPLESLADLGTLYTRYVLNEAVEESFGGEEYSGLLREQGRGGALQSGSLAVAWYAGGELVTEDIARLRTCVILPALWRDFDEVWIGERQCPDRSGTSPEEDWVFLRDGLMYLALHPLSLTNHGRRHALEVSRMERFRAVTFCNYEGEPRDFLGAELRQTCGGLVLALGSETEWGDFAHFRQSCQEIEITDSRYESQRDICVRWGNRQVEVMYDLQNEELLRLKRDGEFVGEPHLEFGPVSVA